MELALFFKAILSLAFVIGLLLLTLWMIKYCEVNGCKNRFMKQLQSVRRVEVVEQKRIDTRNSVVLIRRDNVEHLILLGATQNLILEQNIKPTKVKTND